MIGFLVLPRVPFTPAVAIDGKGRRGREAGNNEFRMVIGWAVCREGDIGDARGDETGGRFVLIANDMIRIVSKRMVEVTTGVGSAIRPRECVSIWRGDAGVEERRKVKKKLWSKRARLYKRMYASRSRSSLSSLCWGSVVGVRVVAVGVSDRRPARSSVAS